MTRVLPLPSLLALVCLLAIQPAAPLAAQDKKDPPADADRTTLIPSDITDYEITLDLKDRKLPVRVQYAVQKGNAIFILPVWVAGGVERVIDGKAVACKPDERLLPADEKRPVRLNVVVRNLLDSPTVEKTIVEQLRARVAEQQGVEAGTKYRIERPQIDLDNTRFTLIGPGLGNDESPSKIALANPVSRPPDGKLSFGLDATAVRKIERDRVLSAGLTLASVTVLPTVEMKVRFEQLEMDAQVRYLRATLDNFRKRVGSDLDSSSGQSPDIIVPLGGGSAETRSQLRSMPAQSLQVTVSTRQGVTELPLMPLLQKAADAMLESGTLDQKNDQQRVAFLMENQVTLSATMGEVKRLAKLDEKGRSDAFQAASDHYYATRRGDSSNYTGSLSVGFKLLGGSVSGGYANST